MFSCPRTRSCHRKNLENTSSNAIAINLHLIGSVENCVLRSWSNGHPGRDRRIKWFGARNKFCRDLRRQVSRVSFHDWDIHVLRESDSVILYFCVRCFYWGRLHYSSNARCIGSCGDDSRIVWRHVNGCVCTRAQRFDRSPPVTDPEQAWLHVPQSLPGDRGQARAPGGGRGPPVCAARRPGGPPRHSRPESDLGAGRAGGTERPRRARPHTVKVYSMFHANADSDLSARPDASELELELRVSLALAVPRMTRAMITVVIRYTVTVALSHSGRRRHGSPSHAGRRP
jgi:hypothetical protein